MPNVTFIRPKYNLLAAGGQFLYAFAMPHHRQPSGLLAFLPKSIEVLREAQIVQPSHKIFNSMINK